MPRAAATLGWEYIDAAAERGTIRIAFAAPEDFTNLIGEVLGGFLAAMLYVDVPSGTAIVAGDIAYRVDVNVKGQVPMGYFVSLEDTMAALGRVARDGDHVLPSHDSAIYERYPDGIA